MARSGFRTSLALDTWAQILGIDPRHFNQVVTPSKPLTTCNRVWKQYLWQENDQVSRESISIAIAEAERMISEYIKYNLLPTWVIDERQRLIVPAIPDVMNVSGLSPRGFPLSQQLDRNHFISGGIEAKTVIVAGAAVVYTDEDGDTFPETATVTVATTVTDPAEIAVYFPGEDGRDEWEVKPLNNPITRRRSVTIAAGVATIVMAREQLVDPDLWNALDPEAVDGDEDTNFLATVDVFRHFNDPQQQVTLMWSPRPSLCDCGTTTCPTCAHSLQTGCLVAKDFRTARVYFQPSAFNATTGVFDARNLLIGRAPDNLRVWYYSGFQDTRKDAPTLEMDDSLARAVAYLSLTFLMNPVCGCSNIENVAKANREDLAANISSPSASLSFQMSDRLLANPFGTKRGAIYAWNMVNSQERTIGQAVVL